MKPHDKVLQDIAAERTRQLEKFHWSYVHDDDYKNGELAKAGACFGLIAAMSDDIRASSKSAHRNLNFMLQYWPWSGRWWTPTDRRSDLVKACALMVAEIERLDRVEEEQSRT